MKNAWGGLWTVIFVELRYPITWWGIVTSVALIIQRKLGFSHSARDVLYTLCCNSDNITLKLLTGRLKYVMEPIFLNTNNFQWLIPQRKPTAVKKRRVSDGAGKKCSRRHYWRYVEVGRALRNANSITVWIINTYTHTRSTESQWKNCEVALKHSSRRQYHWLPSSLLSLRSILLHWNKE